MMDTHSKSWMQIQAYWRQKSNIYRKQEPDSSGYRLAMLAAIKQHIAYDAYCFTLTDPLTLLSTGALTDPALQQLHEQLLITEYANHNHWSYEEMVQHNRYVTRLSEITASNTENNVRYYELLAPAGFSDELRTAFFYEGQCWGFLTLFKRASSGEALFSAADEQQMNALMPTVAEALMRYYYSYDDLPVQPKELEYGFLLLSEQLHIISSNERGNKLLGLLQQAERLQEHLDQDARTEGENILAGADDIQLSDPNVLSASDEAQLSDQVILAGANETPPSDPNVLSASDEAQLSDQVILAGADDTQPSDPNVLTASDEAQLSDQVTLADDPQPSDPNVLTAPDEAQPSYHQTGGHLPKPIQALGCKLLANYQDSQQLSLFIPLSSTRYVTLNAALLHCADPGSSLSKRQIAITIEEASPNSMLTYFMQRYKLTPREQQMVYELLKGSSNKEIAAHLEISSHTVQDHLKSIFAKTEVNSRSELIWKLHTRFSLVAPSQ